MHTWHTFPRNNTHYRIIPQQSISGAFTCLQVSFTLGREIGFYLLQTYIPSTLIVVLSWVSFWISSDSVPARISLGVTTVLTMTTQLSASQQSVPRVSYTKAIDVWMSTCTYLMYTAISKKLLKHCHCNLYLGQKYRIIFNRVDIKVKQYRSSSVSLILTFKDENN